MIFGRKPNKLIAEVNYIKCEIIAFNGLKFLENVLENIFKLPLPHSYLKMIKWWAWGVSLKNLYSYEIQSELLSLRQN